MISDQLSFPECVIFLSSLILGRSEVDFIAKVVDLINCKLDLKQVSTHPHLTGIETRSEVINLWLDDEHCSTNVLAICGMGVSGKTTMAQ